MEDLRLTKLRASLADAIQEWMSGVSDERADLWDSVDTHVSDFAVELMADSAFNVLLAQSDLTSYYQNNGMLKK